jgi:acetyl esterase
MTADDPLADLPETPADAGDEADGSRLEADEPHPDVQRVMAQREKFRLLPFSTLGARGARLLTRIGLWLQESDPPAVGATSDLAIPGPAGDIDVRTYRPDRDGPYPTVVYYHGGGYVLGDLDGHDLFCRHLCVESDCEVVSVAYRRAPEHPFPAAVEDAYAAVEWAASDPDALDCGAGTDRRGLAVAGDSAGGNLAAVTSLVAAERDGPEIDYQALVYPAVGVREDQPSVREHTGLILTEDDLEWFRDCYFGSEIHQRNPYADPSRACDLSAVPPATVVTAGFDPLRDGGVAYARQLVGDGVSVRFRNYPEMVHGFVTMLSETEDVDRATEAVADLGADLRTAFDIE